VPHVLFRLRGLEINSFPAFLFLGVTFGVLAGTKAGTEWGLDPTRLYVATVILVIPALAGSRLLYVLTHWSFFRERPSEIWARGSGGGMLYGGFLLALVSSWPLLRILDLPLGEFWDAGMVALLTGMAFTRIGCTLHGCCAGRCTTGWLALDLTNDRGVRCRRFPLQLMEAGLAVSLVIVAIAWENRPFGGSFFLAALIAYATARLPLGAIRETSDSVRGINISHAISIMIIAASLMATAMML
jgi:phosphatidylglycerol:prolipoprotein diacylglycerol transferase